MHIAIDGHHISITDAIRKHIEKKMAKRAEQYKYDITSVHVVVTKDNTEMKAEIQVHIPHHTIVAYAKDADLYHAINVMFNKLDRQLIKHKEELKKHH